LDWTAAAVNERLAQMAASTAGVAAGLDNMAASAAAAAAAIATIKPPPNLDLTVPPEGPEWNIYQETETEKWEKELKRLIKEGAAPGKILEQVKTSWMYGREYTPQFIPAYEMKSWEDIVAFYRQSFDEKMLSDLQLEMARKGVMIPNLNITPEVQAAYDKYLRKEEYSQIFKDLDVIKEAAYNARMKQKKGLELTAGELDVLNRADLMNARLAELRTLGITGYQRGGPIIEDTLLFGLKSLRPYAMAHKGEHVTPAQMPSVVINIAEMNVREESDIDRIAERLVSKIRLRTGVHV